jgi:Adenosine deaminase
MQNEEALRLVTRDIFEQLAADNVIYAEIRFAPLLHIEGGLSPDLGNHLKTGHTLSLQNRPTEVTQNNT